MMGKILKTGLAVWIGCLSIVPPLYAEVSEDKAESPEDRLSALLSTAGLMSVAPASDLPTGTERANLFLEIGIAYYAVGDSVHATKALRYAHTLDPELGVDHLDQQKDEAGLAQSFVADLSLSQKRDHFARTSRFKAAGRSLIMPGWGQMYRGHKKRGLIALSAALLTGAYLTKAMSDYSSAKDAYDGTNVSELNLDALATGGEIQRPFESRFSSYESKASAANTAAILLAAVWGASVLDNLILEPNRFELRWGIGR
jgi:hypothetical protein